MGKTLIGIDVGGTTIKAGIVDGDGRLLQTSETPTPSQESAEVGVQRIADQARQLVDQAGVSWSSVEGVGIGLPGFLDIPQGKIVKLVNIPWTDIAIKDRLEEELNVPVTIDNDANAAAFGEAWIGAGRGLGDLVCITLGTGIGGGMISGGKLIHGSSGLAGEIGHIRVEENGAICGCGRQGCVETIASATGMIRLAKESILSGEHTKLASKAKNDQLMAKDIFDAASEGDPVAQKVIAVAVDALARMMSILSVVTNPAAFIIGGGVSRAGEQLLAPLRQAYAAYTFADARILPAELGNDAGIIGAARLTVQ
ncbi:glucokinase [Melghirimyces algeriensis]|uniref:Glucokinase n=2 Tax=Melghirimyces algeriensis TaxID=910412 RepID=A0A521D0X4_9BACL|nr:glucokinase [Melghirimyces algeriensis]